MSKNWNQELGEKGEQLAIDLLSSKGIKILERNCQIGREEIDIIAEKGDEILFIEVKTRSTDQYGEPFRFVNKAKQRSVIKAANVYLKRSQTNMEARFDIISVVLNKYRFEIEHIERAFFPHM